MSAPAGSNVSPLHAMTGEDVLHLLWLVEHELQMIGVGYELSALSKVEHGKRRAALQRLESILRAELAR